MKRTWFLTILCIGFTFLTKAQQGAGVDFIPGQDIVAHEQQYANVNFSNQGIPKYPKKFHIAVYVFKDSSLDSYMMTDGDINNAVALLNTNFSPIGWEFEVCEINYIPNFQYNQYYFESQTLEPYVLYRRKNTINLYVSKIVSCNSCVEVANTAEGFATSPSDPLSIIHISKFGITRTHHLTHLMGHFFGLYDTSSDIFGTELVDGNNCLQTGDLLCDTKADLQIITQTEAFRGPLQNCVMTEGFKDPLDNFYIPLTANFMSNYYVNTEANLNDCDCRSRFTPGQFRKMYTEIRNPNNTRLQNLW